jgi:hypothetical protein
MSADNGVYILKTKDGQIRVAHTNAINGLFDQKGNYIPEQITRHFGIKYTKNMDKAVRIATNIKKRLPVCEYGIQFLPYCDKTWDELIEETD